MTLSRDRDPYERTAGRLRQRLRAGDFGQGQPLHIMPLAAELAVSPTPVREALARLAGEGLIERGRAGYLSLRHDATSLADLYRLDEIYGLAALKLAGPSTASQRASPATRAEAYPERPEWVLKALTPIRNAALTSSRQGLWDRLAPFRGVERLVFADADRELAELEGAVGPAAKARALKAYFRRRQRSAADILETIFP